MLSGNNTTNDDLVMDSTDDLDDDLENSKCKEAGDDNKNPSELNEDDKRKRRAIANSNERRRMQSINAGFQTLKSLIPHSSGEKLSKACILQRSADYMQFLTKEKDKLNYRLQIAVKLIESQGLLDELHKHVGLDEHDSHPTSAAKSHCQKISAKRKSLSSISSLLRSDESRQLTDSTNRPSVKCSSEPDDAEKIRTRSSSIDHLIAAAAVSSSAPSSSAQPSSSASEPTKKNLNLNTIFEAIKHVEGARALEQPDVNKPPKKRKYPGEESAQASSANAAASMCYIDLKQLNALCLNQNQMQPTQLALLTSNENKNSTEEQTKKNDKIIGLLVTSS